MKSTGAQETFARLLLQKIRDDRYPSWEQMAVFEQAAPAELTEEYLDVLMEKIADERWPSNTMLRHIAQLFAAQPAR